MRNRLKWYKTWVEGCCCCGWSKDESDLTRFVAMKDGRWVRIDDLIVKVCWTSVFFALDLIDKDRNLFDSHRLRCERFESGPSWLVSKAIKRDRINDKKLSKARTNEIYELSKPIQDWCGVSTVEGKSSFFCRKKNKNYVLTQVRATIEATKVGRVAAFQRAERRNVSHTESAFLSIEVVLSQRIKSPKKIFYEVWK